MTSPAPARCTCEAVPLTTESIRRRLGFGTREGCRRFLLRAGVPMVRGPRCWLVMPETWRAVVAAVEAAGGDWPAGVAAFWRARGVDRGRQSV